MAFALGALLAATLRAASPSGQLLWEGAAGSPCRLALELGDRDAVEIRRSSAPARLLGAVEPARLRATDDAGRLRLQLTPSPGEEPARLLLETPASCELDVSTHAGSVEARGPIEAAWRASSVTGDLTLWVEASPSPLPDLAVSLATSGEIVVDFSVEIETLHHREPAKVGSITLGHGSVPVKLQSRQGAVRVLRLRPAAEPSPASRPGGTP